MKNSLKVCYNEFSEVKKGKTMKAKTLEQLWDEQNENRNKKIRFFIKSLTNQTSKYEFLTICRSKNLAILSHRGTGWSYFKKYYEVFVLNRSRWFLVK